MSTVRESIEVAVPTRVAYEQLAHFENYPQFMSGVMSMATIDDSTAHMVLDIGGNRAEFDARITETRPGEFLCWEALTGPQVSEALRLEETADGMTRVIAELQIDARELMPAEQHATDVLNRRLKADLKGFKRFCEEAALRNTTTTATATAGAGSEAAPIGDATGGTPARVTPATIARGIAASIGRAGNERPTAATPATGNLGPLQSVAGRTPQTRQTQPGPTMKDRDAVPRANPADPAHGDSF